MQPQQMSTVKAPGPKAVQLTAPAAHAVFAGVHGHAQAIILPSPDLSKTRR